MKVYAIIMAGGGGTRFWPLSRQAMPKQLLNLTNKDLMINETIDRILPVVDKENIFIVTNNSQVERMKSATAGRVEMDHILSEPAARNTSACIGYAAIEILHKYGDGIMCVFPADHYIKEPDNFVKVIKKGIDVAQNNEKLVTIGICPTFPSTGYGYIKYIKADTPAMEVEEFKEKPDYDTAKEYIAEGSYLWNSGMFIWKASTIMNAFERYLPKVYKYLITIAEVMGKPEEYEYINAVYPRIPSISIDYGIMEHSNEVVVIPGDFGWNDVGSWDMLDVIHKPDCNGNIILGEHVNIETTNCVSYSNKRLIATLGVDNLIIVETDDAILVSDKNKAQDIKNIVDLLNQQERKEFL